MATQETQEGTEAGHSAQAQGGTFPPFDTTTYPSQLLWFAITFGLLYYVMSRVALPRIADILETRRDRIAGDLSEAERLKRETDDAIAAYEQALAEAKNKAHGIAQTARDKAKQDIDNKRLAVEDDLAEKMAEAEARIAQVKADALGEVDEIAQETASAVITQLVGGRTTKKAISDAVAAAKSGA